MRRPKRYLLAHEFEQLRELRTILGITKLAKLLDLPFYACRNMVAVQGRVTKRTIQHVRDYLPDLVAQHMPSAPAAAAAEAPLVSTSVSSPDPRLLLPAEIDQLTLLHDQLGVSRLSEELGIEPETCRALMVAGRVHSRSIDRARANLPCVVKAMSAMASADEARSRERRVADDNTRSVLASLLPYVSRVRLAYALGVSPSTLRALTAGYRSARTSTIESLRTRLDALLQPPFDGLRAVMLRPPPTATVSGLRVGATPPIRGLDISQTESLLS